MQPYRRVSRHDKTYLTWNLPRKKILTEKCYVKVLKCFEPARSAVENWAMGVLHRWLDSSADPSKLFITRASLWPRENKDFQKSIIVLYTWLYIVGQPGP